jgi:hypothetical protein
MNTTMEKIMADAIDHSQWDAPLNMTGVILIVIVSCVVGLVWAFVSYLGVKKIDVKNGQQGEYEQGLNEGATEHQVKLLLEIGEKISEVSIH